MRTSEEWAALITRVADRGVGVAELREAMTSGVAEREAFARGFRDDLGIRQPTYGPVLAWVLHLPTEKRGVPGEPHLGLWTTLLGREGGAPCGSERGPLFPALARQGVEAWTEAELAGLHALWWHAAWRPAARERAIEAARWHVAESQPDNATNRPWAIALFASLASEGDAESASYAGTLLHNCQVESGRADRFSTVLLVDAARRLSDGLPPRA